MKTYKYILLDWDGNLAKTLDIWLEACKIVLERRGRHLTDEEIAMSFGQLDAYLRDWGFADEDIPKISNEALQLGHKKLPDLEMYPDVIDVMHQLKQQGKQIALVTTSYHHVIVDALDKFDLHQYFDVVISHHDVTNHKPHAEPIEKAIELLGGSKEETLMVGDSDKDLGSARNAGVDSALFYPPEHRKFYDLEKLKKQLPTYIMSDFKQLLEIAAD